MAAFGAHLEKHASVPSTMPLAHALAERADVASGAAIWADEQTAGKGRSGRKWESPPARSLMVSFMLRRDEHPIALNRLVMAAALATAAACRATGIEACRVGCKWPNDIVIFDFDDADLPRKVAGILVETQLAGDAWDHAVLGIGINVNQLPDELPAVEGSALPPCSLRIALSEEQPNTLAEDSPPIDRDALFRALCSALDWIEGLTAEEILADWRRLLWLPKEEVVLLEQGNIAAQGWLEGTDEAGNLLLRCANGEIRAWETGDLSLRLRMQ